ncbi:hypothetical protein BDY19DRAFT_1052136 [Irpex rosettiformis]|uniref:Uncharacterized protein n=1 Tax=Irpex rosettiformis TaxID=378272 RepID=A0ACB8UJP0_9APHY|nr:hypothetical protein BDY19DRAFT_1052136 [Irpex rosettiformis]
MASVSSGPRPRSWEVLDDIVPTSPSASYGNVFLASLETSGEIPIILDPGIVVDDSLILDERQRSTTYPMSSSSSSTTRDRESIGTFGIPRTLLSRRSRDIFSDAQANGLNRDSSLISFVENTPTTPKFTSQFLAPQPEECYYDKKPGVHSSLSAHMVPSVSQVSLARSLGGRIQPSTSQSSWASHSPSLGTPTRRRFKTAHSPSFASSLSMIILAAGSAPGSPTVASSLVTEAQAYASRYRQNIPALDSRSTFSNKVDFPRSVSPNDDRLSINSPVLTTFSRPSSPAPPLVMDETVTIVREGPRIRSRSCATTKSNDSNRSGRSAMSTPTTRTKAARSTNSPHSADFRKRIHLPTDTLQESSTAYSSGTAGVPGSITWLETVFLRLWMDQEGFRLAQPVFKLSAYTTAPGDPHNKEQVTEFIHGTAEFRPVKKYAFVFHHASLDPAPILRKLTCQDEDGVDYISRQATLTIKSNGVYSVFGSEDCDRSPLSPTLSNSGQAQRSEPMKLTWRFEYRVEDRYVEGTDKLRPGEKSIIPILFSCSPGLLHPSQGKKIKIMHVLRKGLVPKLASAKMEGSASAPTSPEASSFDIIPPVLPAAKEHRRVHSTVEGVSERGRQPIDPPTGESQKIGYGLKRSRAMSFSPSPKPQLEIDAGLLDKHILPPELVRKLLDNPEVAVIDQS